MDFLKSREMGRSDRFVPAMSDFITIAAYKFSEMEEMLVEMKQKVSGIIHMLMFLLITWPSL